MIVAPNTPFSELADTARRDFADRNPQSRLQYARAREVLPGGHTRTVLTHAPFPLTFASGIDATLTDLDGHTYIDALGDYTAGLLGHSDGRVREFVMRALVENTSVGGIHPYEERLARLMCVRFGIDRVRFTNSGTEANLMAITTAIHATGRRKVMVFNGGYHGGVLYFVTGSPTTNAPYDFVIAPYNDLTGTLELIEQHRRELAAVLVEPMQGSGGCLPSTPGFLAGVFAAARTAGAVCICDEVMTSRHGPRGMAALLGAEPDLTTYGKYIGGGFSFGAFGGIAELMDQYDSNPPSGPRPCISHAGTFNNNIASMAAGTVVLGDVFTPEIAVAHTTRGDEFRAAVATVLARSGIPMSVTGFGSMMSLHALAEPPTDVIASMHGDPALLELVFFGLLRRSVYTAARGMINLSLVHTDEQLAAVLDALGDCLDEIAVETRSP